MNKHVVAFLEKMEREKRIQDAFYACRDWHEAYQYACSVERGFSLNELVRGFCTSNQRR